MKLVWKYENTGKGYASVSVVNGTVYTAGDFGEDCKIVALDLSGKLKWEGPAGKAWNAKWNGSRGTPSVTNGIVYYMNNHGVVYALKADSGEFVWSVDVKETFKGRPGNWGYSETPLLYDNMVICQPGGEKSLLVALDAKSGALIWACTDMDEKAGYCSATVAEIEGIKQVVTFTKENVIGVDIKSGKLLWSFPHKTKPDVNVSTPVVFENYVVSSSGYGIGSKCYRIENGKPVNVWKTISMDNHHGGIIAFDGKVYGSGDKNNGWFCVDIKTGKDLYQERGVGKGSCLLADGMLYTQSERGKLALVPLSTSEHKAAASMDLPKEGEGNFWAYPVIANGRLYLRHDNFLYSYNVVSK